MLKQSGPGKIARRGGLSGVILILCASQTPIEPLVGIGKVAIERFLEVFYRFGLGQAIGRDVQLDAAGDENAVLEIDSKIEFFSHGSDSEMISGCRRLLIGHAFYIY